MSPIPKKILLLGAGFTTNNMGVWALASGAIASAWHAFPDAHIFFFDYNSEPATYHVLHPAGIGKVELINIRFSKKFWNANNIAWLLFTSLLNNLVPFKSFRKKCIERNFWLNHIQTADIIGSIAGGDSFSDIYGIGRLTYVALPQILVLLLGKPLVLLPQTIGPFNSSLSKFLGRFILKRAWKVYSRDRESLEVARGLIGDDRGRLEFCHDMGFALQPIIKDERKPTWLLERDCIMPLVGLNVSGLLFMGGYTQNNMFGLKTDYRRLINSVITHLARNYKLQVILIPHVFGSAENRESDRAACREVYREVDLEIQTQIHLLEEEYNQHEMKALIGCCDFFIGSRMHACIGALSQCIPAVGLAYSRKFKGVFDSIEMGDLVIDLSEYTETSTISRMDQLFQNRHRFKAQLEQKMPEVRETLLGLFKRASC
jgi:colanic acid/amylovoran biosynthesis protein